MCNEAVARLLRQAPESISAIVRERIGRTPHVSNPAQLEDKITKIRSNTEFAGSVSGADCRTSYGRGRLDILIVGFSSLATLAFESADLDGPASSIAPSSFAVV